MCVCVCVCICVAPDRPRRVLQHHPPAPPPSRFCCCTTTINNNAPKQRQLAVCVCVSCRRLRSCVDRAHRSRRSQRDVVVVARHDSAASPASSAIRTSDDRRRLASYSAPDGPGHEALVGAINNLGRNDGASFKQFAD